MDCIRYTFLLVLVACNNVEAVIVRTNEGRVQGLAMNLSLELPGLVKLGLSIGQQEYYSFRGIPYAEPPVGKLRFKAPIRHKPWKGVKPAIKHGSVCPQYIDSLHIYALATENCLFVNVYTKDLKPKELKPVLVFVHGGRFKFGSGDATLYGADYIVQKDVILVTLNYRLDSLGFLNLGIPEVPGNAGLKDQRLALEWVRDNIHHFGGNPKKVTLMGQSAGSASVIYHLMSPMSKGLFHRAIAMSGVPFCEWALTYKLKKRSFEFGRMLGKETEDPYALLEHLQSLSLLELLNKFPIVIPEEKYWNFGFKMTAFQPCPEEDYGQERFLVEPFTETLKRGNLNHVDLMIGYTSMEGLSRLTEVVTTNISERYNTKRDLLIPRDILLGPGPVDRVELAERIKLHYFGDGPIKRDQVANIIQYLSNEVFVYNVNRFLKYLNTKEFKTYLYKFSIETSRNIFSGERYGIHGVAHTDDLLYLFETAFPTTDDLLFMTRKVQRYINRVVTLFTNFVKYGNPTPDDFLGVTWEQYSDEFKAYLNINKTLIPGHYPDADVNVFWSRIYEDGNAILP